MSYLLEAVGRGLLGRLLDAFEHELPGEPLDTRAALEQRVEQSPTSGDLLLRLGRVCMMDEQIAAAQDAFTRAAKLDHCRAKAELGLACAAYDVGRLEAALRHLSIAQAHEPKNAAIAFAIGMCYELNEDLPAATASYERSLSLCPRLRNAHERLAAIALVQGRPEVSREVYEELARLEPGSLDVLLVLATLYLQTGRPSEAIERYQQALLIEPQPDEGEQLPPLDDSERLASAIESMEELCRTYPGVSEFHVHLADAYAKAGRDREAVREYGEALALRPSFLEATVKLGSQHLRQGRFADAAEAFNRAVELNDRLLLAFVGLGVAQEACGHDNEADATLHLAVSLEPNSTLLFAEAARLHMRAESLRARQNAAADRLELDDPPAKLDATDDVDQLDATAVDELLHEALRRHRQAIANQPQQAELYYHYGLLLRQVGELSEAERAFRTAVEINPTYVKALVKLGLTLKETGAAADAIEAFRRALKLRPGYVDVHYQLGLLFACRNQFELAVEEFEHAVAGNGRNLAFRQNLALALQNIGMLDRAAATWRTICEVSEGHAEPGARRRNYISHEEWLD